MSYRLEDSCARVTFLGVPSTHPRWRRVRRRRSGALQGALDRAERRVGGHSGPPLTLLRGAPARAGDGRGGWTGTKVTKPKTKQNTRNPEPRQVECSVHTVTEVPSPPAGAGVSKLAAFNQLRCPLPNFSSKHFLSHFVISTPSFLPHLFWCFRSLCTLRRKFSAISACRSARAREGAPRGDRPSGA